MPFQHGIKYDVGFGEKAESYTSSATPSPISSRHSTPPFEHPLNTKPLRIQPLREATTSKRNEDTSNPYSKLLTVVNLLSFQKSIEENDSLV